MWTKRPTISKLHKLFQWEYWPTYIVYFITSFLWLCFALYFRSFRFYALSNPGIKNGGLYGDSKMAIYKLLPESLYPKTTFIQKDKIQDFNAVLQSNYLNFPLIAKPDIGLRGKNVQLISSLEELIDYQKNADGDFLLQEYCDLPFEMGVFYHRFPNSSIGKITGLTGKIFLTVKGNGKDTLLTILRNNPRHAFQIPSLSRKINLDEVLGENEEKVLEPIGNHNRGTQFLNATSLLTPMMEESLNNIFSKVEGFYYGRLDIKFKSLQSLEKGHDLKIIEINGAKSEPTHIYDPKYSFIQGQLEIIRHQRIFFRIVKMNFDQKSKNYFL